VWTNASGVADLHTGRPMRPSDRFRAGSLTKPFVATVVLQLVAEGKLSLSDTVERWLPGILPYGDQITVRQLLNHTSGVPDYTPAPLAGLYRGDRFRSWRPGELVGLVAGQPPDFPPGSAWSYSNTGYVLLGMIIERVTGQRLGRELERRIFRPLRMRDTSFVTNFPWLAGRHADGYSLQYDDGYNPIEGTLFDITVFNPSFAWAAGAVLSNEADLAPFFGALLGGRLAARGAGTDEDPGRNSRRSGLRVGPAGRGLALRTVVRPRRRHPGVHEHHLQQRGWRARVRGDVQRQRGPRGGRPGVCAGHRAGFPRGVRQ
jgi:D-alanyl-D-alanine carboxypeptidase